MTTNPGCANINNMLSVIIKPFEYCEEQLRTYDGERRAAQPQTNFFNVDVELF